MRITIVPFDHGRRWTPVKLSPNGEGRVRFGRVTIVVTMTRCRHKLSLRGSLVRPRKVGKLSYRKKFKRSWPLENENESRKKKVNRVSPPSYVSIRAW